MKNYKKYFLIISCFLFSIVNYAQDTTQINVRDLKFIEERVQFLEGLYHQLLESKMNQFKIEQGLGKNSVEYLEAVKQEEATDSINLIIIDEYLEAFGYPDEPIYGSTASKAPMYLIKGKGCGVSFYTKNVNFLKNAYYSGHLKGVNFKSYLDHCYVQKFSEKLKYQSSPKIHNQIESLITELDKVYFESK